MWYNVYKTAIQKMCKSQTSTVWPKAFNNGYMSTPYGKCKKPLKIKCDDIEMQKPSAK